MMSRNTLLHRPKPTCSKPIKRSSFQGNYTFVDANTNGISDAWEKEFFGGVSPQRTPTTDTDGDGLSDYANLLRARIRPMRPRQ